MKNVIELRNELCELFNDIKTDSVDLVKAKEMTNAAGKIINSVKLELVYAALRKEQPVIDFMGGELSPSDRNKLLAAKNGVGSSPIIEADVQAVLKR